MVSLGCVFVVFGFSMASFGFLYAHICVFGVLLWVSLVLDWFLSVL